MDSRGRTRNRLGQPQWLPSGTNITVLPAGRWWDAIGVHGDNGERVFRLLLETDRLFGPVIRDAWLSRPKLYFLVPPGTGQTWDVPGCSVYGPSAYIGVPGRDKRQNLGPWPCWAHLPGPEDPEPLVNPQALRMALFGLRVAS